MTEQEVRYEPPVSISVSAEEFRVLEAAAKKRGISVEECLEQIIEDLRKLDEEMLKEKNEMARLAFLNQGDKLMARLFKLEGKYCGMIGCDDGYLLRYLSASKEELLDRIHSDLEFVHSCVQQFSEPDRTRKEWDDPDMNLAAKWQRECEKCFPGKTWDELRVPALRSYKRLEKDFKAFRDEVENAPDEVFNVIFK